MLPKCDTLIAAAGGAFLAEQARDIRRLVAELSLASSDFAHCWQTQVVLAREGGERTFNHPAMVRHVKDRNI
ncbi:MmyB family transcriptional regulator [Bradyrhizobium sp. DASA03120]|uniref:MmyB family transcriptional regulator n=1 Tax=Bradyrhizobium sp. SMVTL-02 TaxID=3395917 RepID=UPI003F6E596C